MQDPADLPTPANLCNHGTTRQDQRTASSTTELQPHYDDYVVIQINGDIIRLQLINLTKNNLC